MAAPEVRPAPTQQSGNLAVVAPRRERLAIVSTRNKLCGIAAYTQALERQLADLFDITVFDLDQYLLRGHHGRVRALGDRHIKEICRQIAEFDTINVQLEYGTLGRSAKDACRRFAWLAAAAPRLSVTFHSLERPPIFPLADFAKAVFTARWRTAEDIRRAYANSRRRALDVPRLLRREQRHKLVSIIVHNRRDLSDATHLHGLRTVYHHPLTFLSASEVQTIQATAGRRRFPTLEALDQHAILIGVFGFLNDYKGFGTVVRALRQLSSNYHLLIFGGIHPNEIVNRQPIHPYIASLLRDAGLKREAQKNLDIEQSESFPSGGHPPDLSGRVHFMGALEDADFLAGMAMCDVVVFPYLEVGQSSSGPISQAVELGCRIIASRTHNFLEFAAYHPDTIEFFDIGNHLELAERIAARRQYAVRRSPPRYNVETSKAVYLAANSAPTAGPAAFFRRSGAPEALQAKG
jgi:glycosyltransferase involved in cell wall biosynthesis